MSDKKTNSTRVNLDRYTYVACRTFSHAWDDKRLNWTLYLGKKTPKWPRAHQELVGSVECLRCGTLRYTRFDRRSFERMGGHAYQYPDGYLLAGSKLVRHDFAVHMARQGLVRAQTIDLTEVLL